jgi:hypothetical protein
MLVLALHLARHHDSLMSQPLPAGQSLLIGLGAAAVVALPGLWLVAQHVDTIAHEGAHALMGSVRGGKVGSVKLHRDGSGVTPVSHPGGRGAFLTGFIGYLGPSLFGLAAARLDSLGYIRPVLWLAVILLAILLLSVRNSFGFLTVIATGGFLFLVARSGSAGLEEVVAYGLAWFLLLSGLRVALLVFRGGAGDADNLRASTSVPRVVWFVLWLAGAAAALWVGGRLLLSH